jgi:hypothetical protein
MNDAEVIRALTGERNALKAERDRLQRRVEILEGAILDSMSRSVDRADEIIQGLDKRLAHLWGDSKGYG